MLVALDQQTKVDQGGSDESGAFKGHPEPNRLHHVSPPMPYAFQIASGNSSALRLAESFEKEPTENFDRVVSGPHRVRLDVFGKFDIQTTRGRFTF